MLEVLLLIINGFFDLCTKVCVVLGALWLIILSSAVYKQVKDELKNRH